MRAQSLNNLSARKVETLKEPGLHADGGGLYLSVTKSGSKSWRFIYRLRGKRREKGLGALAAVGLADAREKAAEMRGLIADGKDPLDVREVSPDGTTFGEEATALMNSLEGGWRNEKHKWQWRQTLKTYCAPMWAKPVHLVETQDVVDVLRPIWLEKHETANRLRGRIERVLDAAKVNGRREGENPARYRGHLELILPKRKRGEKRHHPAMPYKDVPDFFPALRTRVSTAARALEFLILTAARTSEVLKMTWGEVDLEAATWTVPGERMKMGKEHVVTLSAPAVALLKATAIFGTKAEAPVFPNAKGACLSNMAMEMLLRRMDEDEVTVHGMRSAFRDWVGEETDFPRELAEMALAHQVGNEVERAYRRGTALAKRRELMNEWAAHVMQKAC